MPLKSTRITETLKLYVLKTLNMSGEMQ